MSPGRKLYIIVALLLIVFVILPLLHFVAGVFCTLGGALGH